MEYCLGFFVGILPAILSALFTALFLPLKISKTKDIFYIFCCPILLYDFFYFLIMELIFGKFL